MYSQVGLSFGPVFRLLLPKACHRGKKEEKRRESTTAHTSLCSRGLFSREAASVVDCHLDVNIAILNLLMVTRKRALFFSAFFLSICSLLRRRRPAKAAAKMHFFAANSIPIERHFEPTNRIFLISSQASERYK